MGKLLEELKRRKVFRIAGVYAVVGWVLAQIAEFAVDTFSAPQWVQQMFVVFLLLGFPLAIILAWAYEITPAGVKPDFTAQSAPTTTSNTDRKLIYATFALVLLVAGIQLSNQFLSDNDISANRSTESASFNTTTSVIRSSINLNHPLPRVFGGLRTVFDITADGSFLAYAKAAEGYWMLRNLATQETRVLEGTGNGKAKFSPSGQMMLLASGTTGDIGVQSVQGGPIRPLPIEGTLSAIWLNDEQIIYQHADGDPRILSLEDRTEISIPGLNVAGAGAFAGAYVFNSLPSGSAFLYKEYPPSAQARESTIQAYDLKNERKILITDDGFFPQYVNSGHVLFLRNGDLWAVPFDADSLRVTGGEARVIVGVDQVSQFWGAYSVSDSGRLVYLKGVSDLFEFPALAWTDLQGNSETIPIQSGNYTNPRLSPDGEKVALTRIENGDVSNVWVYELGPNILGKRTFSDSASRAIWSADSNKLFYHNSTSLRGDIWRINADGTGQQELVFNGLGRAQHVVTGEGRLLIIEGPGNASDISSLRLSDDVWVRESVLESDYDLSAPSVSPDGRWLVYVSAETGQPEVYVRPYPNVNERRWQVSSQGGRDPVWSPAGDGLFYYNLATSTVLRSELPISSQGEEFNFEQAVPITQIDRNAADDIGAYSISTDGKRVLHFMFAEDAYTAESEFASFELVENWFLELQELAPANLR